MAKELKESENIDEELVETFKAFGADDTEGGMTMLGLGNTMEKYGEKLSQD